MLVIAPHSSYRTAPFIEAARKCGIEVLIASEGRHSLVATYAEGLHLNLHETEAALAIILEEAFVRPFAGIIGTDDVTTELAALASRRLGLPHNEPEAVRIARRKDLARACLQEAGVPVPRHLRISLDHPLLPQLKGMDFPCVVKPLAMAASRGVIRADSEEEFVRACARIERILAEEKDQEERRHLLVEEFIPGFEVAVEGMLTDGQLELLALFDKPDPLNGPYFEETYYITPSRLDVQTQGLIAQRVTQAARAYGLMHGPLHAECRINEEGAWILEFAARTIGGMCSRLFRFQLGCSLEELVLAHAVGVSLKRQPESGAAGVLMIPIPKAGLLRRVEGVLAARRVPHIEELMIQVRDGYELVPLPEGSSYLGFIFSRAPSPAEAEAALRHAHAQLNVVVAPLWRGVTINAA